MGKKVLVVDDDKDLCTIIKRYMDNEGYEVDLAHTGSRGLLQLGRQQYHLIILDVMLPEIDGFSVLSSIRSVSNVPVLMLTAKDDEGDKIKGLREGADDYMTKPFNMSELLARAQSIIRRYTDLGQADETYITQKKIETAGMTVDPASREVLIDGSSVGLTGKEFDLLYFLASNPGRVFTKKQIYNQVWEDEYAFDDSNIMAFISKLRKKIETDNSPKYIQTIRGVGYRFVNGVK